jgi:ATP-binding protein involved in chromosome partitioning
MAFFSGENPSPFRGGDLSNALIELLAITQWGDLDILVVDMPPGITDATLDVLLLMRRCMPILVAIPSPLSLNILKKTVRLMRGYRIHVLGIIENMRRESTTSHIEIDIEGTGIPVLGSIPFDPLIESAFGDPERLLKTVAFEELSKVATKVSEISG